MRDTAVRLNGVTKSFTMHLRGGAVLPAVRDVSFEVRRGECVVLGGPSGAGKSSILRMIYGNYRVDRGEILLHDGAGWVDIASVSPRRVLGLRKSVIGYVSQFLRVIPRVSALDLVSAEAFAGGFGQDEARARAAGLLSRLNLPERLWHLPPATFSGGEQQRVNIARCFAASRPILLLDEPTASLDAASAGRVVELIAERRDMGTAILAVFHDAEIRRQVADRVIDMASFAHSEAG